MKATISRLRIKLDLELDRSPRIAGSNLVEMDGEVLHALPRKFSPGDRVKLALSATDSSRGAIVRRYG